MSANRQLNMSNESYLVLNNRNNDLYDVYLGKRDPKPTYSVWGIRQKSTTFHDTGKVVIGSNYSVAHKPVLDNDALVLQAALLQYEKERQYYWSDLALQIMWVGVCIWFAVSLVIWGSV